MREKILAVIEKNSRIDLKDLAVLLGTIVLFVPLAAVAARGLARAGRLA